MLLARLEREKSIRPLHAPQKGELMSLAEVQNGQFVHAGQELMTIRHFLTRDEVVARIGSRFPLRGVACGPRRVRSSFHIQAHRIHEALARV